MLLRKFVYPFEQGLFLYWFQRLSADVLHCVVGNAYNFGNSVVAEELARGGSGRSISEAK